MLAGTVADEDSTMPAAVCDGGVWTAVRAVDALEHATVIATEYQLVARGMASTHTVVVDEAHEVTLKRALTIATSLQAGARLVLVSATPTTFMLQPTIFGRPVALRVLPPVPRCVRIVPGLDYLDPSELQEIGRAHV